MTTSSGTDINRKQRKLQRRGAVMMMMMMATDSRNCLGVSVFFLQWSHRSPTTYGWRSTSVSTDKQGDRSQGWTDSCTVESNKPETDSWINQWDCSRVQEAHTNMIRCKKRKKKSKLWWDGGLLLLYDRGSLVFYGHCKRKKKPHKTSIHTDVPATSMLYDIVNAVYTKMYFLWKLWMCTVERVVNVKTANSAAHSI